jgi:hypothetical protein
MLGFAFASSNIAVMWQDYKKYVSEVIKNDSATEIESVGKFLKRTASDPRTKVLWVDHVTTLKRIQQDWPAEKMAGVLIAVFDVPENLAKEGIKIVDAELEAKTDSEKARHTSTMHRYDLSAAMEGASLGYAEAAKAAPKFVQPDAPTKLSPAGTLKRSVPQDSLVKIFDPMLEAVPAPKRAKAAGYIAARLEGILTKEEWIKVLGRIEKYGLAPELVKAGVRTYRDAGHLKPLREAVRSVVVDSVELDIAAQVANARSSDLDWVNTNWPLSNISPEMFGQDA